MTRLLTPTPPSPPQLLFWKRLFGEPLIHFPVIGAALLVVFHDMRPAWLYPEIPRSISFVLFAWIAGLGVCAFVIALFRMWMTGHLPLKAERFLFV